MTQPTYRVAEFAALAGITVRTLQYYHRIELLHPSGVTDARYRLYQPSDLVRLQQILTLKWMGFELSEIKQMLDSERYDLRTSLVLQKQAVDEEIERLQSAASALERAIGQTDTGALEPETVRDIIHGVTQQDGDERLRHYYSEDAWAGIETRRISYTPQQAERDRQRWQTLYEQFAQHRGEAPDSPAVQALAAQMFALIEEFTAGDRGAWEGLERLSSEPDAVPAKHQMGDPETRMFMGRALAHYRNQQNKKGAS